MVGMIDGLIAKAGGGEIVLALIKIASKVAVKPLGQWIVQAFQNGNLTVIIPTFLGLAGLIALVAYASD